MPDESPGKAEEHGLPRLRLTRRSVLHRPPVHVRAPTRRAATSAGLRPHRSLRLCPCDRSAAACPIPPRCPIERWLSPHAWWRNTPIAPACRPGHTPRRPNSETTKSCKASSWSSFDASVRTAITRPPAELIRCAVSCVPFAIPWGRCPTTTCCRSDWSGQRCGGGRIRVCRCQKSRGAADSRT